MKTNQETFNLISTKLVEQGEQSFDGVRCMYRDHKGRRCAAGHILPDPAYKGYFERHALGTLNELDDVICATGHDFDFVHELQRLHDWPALSCWLSIWSAQMRELATRQNLSTAALDDALAARAAAQVTT